MKNQILKMNKRGIGFSGWIEAILFSLLFVIILGTIIVGMNTKYNKNYDSTMGLGTNDTLTQLTGLQDSFSTATSEGEASNNAFSGISLSTSWQLIKNIVSISWNFISGAWIIKTVQMAGLPIILGLILRMLYFFSIGFILIKLLFKVVV